MRIPASFSLLAARSRLAQSALVAFTLAACGSDVAPPPDAGEQGPSPSCGLVPFIPSNTLVYGVDGGTCARVERRDLSEPNNVYKAIPYEALRVAIVIDGVGIDVVDTSALTYTSTHHNWADEATAREGDVLARVRIHFVIDMPSQLELTLLDATLDDVEREEHPLAGPVVISRETATPE